MRTIYSQCEAAFQASTALALLPGRVRNAALLEMAKAIDTHTPYLVSENQKDQESGRLAGLSEALIDRLSLTPSRLAGISESLRTIATLPDPLGEIIGGWVRPNGLKLSKIRVPLGVIGMIYEARPNVTADAIALCVKTGNAVVLRGSSTAAYSNLALAKILTEAATAAGIPSDAIQLLDDLSREGVQEFVTMRQFLTVVIPRGGASLIQSVIRSSQVPTIETGVGNCHIFVDASANQAQALDIIVNAKTQRPSVCNTCETVLVHADIAAEFLPKLGTILLAKQVEIRGCERTTPFIPQAVAATPLDWETEFLDLILAVKVVDSTQAAIAHIRQFGTHHSEAILSNSMASIEAFKQAVDAAAVLVNASTRFVDGGEFGFGAELGISTQKLHARGPMGLPELTTLKYIVEGNGHIRP